MRGLAVIVICVAALAVGACGGKSYSSPEPPDVVGLALPDAKKTLRDAGFGASVKADDTLFGVIVEENFEVCSESREGEHVVTLHVAKHGC